MNRVYNFAPGPSMLATEVLEQVQKDLEEVGEEILKAAEEVEKTIDSLAGEWQK